MLLGNADLLQKYTLRHAPHAYTHAPPHTLSACSHTHTHTHTHKQTHAHAYTKTHAELLQQTRMADDRQGQSVEHTCCAVGAQLDYGAMEDAHSGRQPSEQQLPCHRAALFLCGGKPQQALPPWQPAVPTCVMFNTHVHIEIQGFTLPWFSTTSSQLALPVDPLC